MRDGKTNLASLLCHFQLFWLVFGVYVGVSKFKVLRFSVPSMWGSVCHPSRFPFPSQRKKERKKGRSKIKHTTTSLLMHEFKPASNQHPTHYSHYPSISYSTACTFTYNKQYKSIASERIRKRSIKA